MRQAIQRLKRKEESAENFINSALRKARTRTLIQAGGLLQKDIECKNQMQALFGALLELRSLIKETNEYSHTYLALKGKVGFAEATHSLKK